MSGLLWLLVRSFSCNSEVCFN